MLAPTVALNNSGARRRHRQTGAAHVTSLIRAMLASAVLACHGPIAADVLANWSRLALARQFPMDRPRLDKALADTLAQIESGPRRSNGAIVGAAIGEIVAAASPQIRWRSAGAAASGTCARACAEQRAQLIGEDNHAR